MAKKKTTQTLAEQWAAYLYLKKETKLCIPAMDAMRHAAQSVCGNTCTGKSYLENEMHPGRRVFLRNSFWYTVS